MRLSPDSKCTYEHFCHSNRIESAEIAQVLSNPFGRPDTPRQIHGKMKASATGWASTPPTRSANATEAPRAFTPFPEGTRYAAEEPTPPTPLPEGRGVNARGASRENANVKSRCDVPPTRTVRSSQGGSSRVHLPPFREGAGGVGSSRLSSVREGVGG